MSFFDDEDDFVGSEMPPLREDELANPNESETGDDEFDAFNEETFETALEEGGDWEAMHDQLIMLEGENGDGGGGLDRTLTKLDDADDEDGAENDFYNDDVVEKKHAGKGNLQPNNNLKQQAQQQQQQQQQQPQPSQLQMFQQHQLQQQQLQQFQQNLLNSFNKHAANNTNSGNSNNNAVPPAGMNLPSNGDKMPFMPFQPTPELQQVVLEQQRLQALLNELTIKILQTSSMPDPNSDQFKLVQQLQLQLQLKQKQYQMLVQQQLLNQLKTPTNANVIESLLLAQQQQQLLQQNNQQQGGFPNKAPPNLNNLLGQNSAPGLNNNNMPGMQQKNNVPSNEQMRMQSILNSVGFPQGMNQQMPNQMDPAKVKEMMEKFGQMNLANIQAQQQQHQNQMDPAKLQEQQKQLLMNLMQSKLQQQQQQQQSQPQPQPPQQQAPMPSMPPGMPQLKMSNVKTLEEIENELLNQSNSKQSSASSQNSQSNQGQFGNKQGPGSILNSLMQHPPPGSPLNQQDKNHKDDDRSNLNRLLGSMGNKNNQNQMPPNQMPQPPMPGVPQMDMMKMIPYVYAYLSNNNIGNFNSLNEQQQKQLIQLFVHQQQQFLQQQQQQQLQNNQHQANNNNSSGMNEQMMQQQQQLAALLSNMNNGNLPPNLQHLNQQQKTALLSQLENMQASNMLQQQMLHRQQQQQQNQANSNDEGSQQSNLDYRNDMNNSNDGQNNKRNNNNNNMNRRHNDRSDNLDRRNNNNNNNNRQQHRSNFANNNTNNPPGDKLAGMMTEKEKNWVVNVQMLQLQIDDPYTFDFYYTAWMLKKKQFSMQNNNSAALKTSVLFQSNNKHEREKNYRPLTFENSLGKVTMSNFHHPRALIDINKAGDQQQQATNQLASHIEGLDDQDEDNKKEKKNMSTILLEIEKMYQVYLNIDEIEHKILKAPEELRVSLFQDRRAKVDKLASMMCSENFAHYLFVPKGKRLLGKCIPTFNIHQTKQILGYFMQYIYIISKNNISLDEIYSQLSYAIDTQKFNDLVDIVNQFVHLYSRQSNQLYQTIFSNKFGLTYLLKFFSKSDLVQQDDYDNDVKSIWSAYLNLVLTGLATVRPTLMSSDGNLEWNIGEEYQLNHKAVLDNFAVNADLWTASEKKLKELFKFISDD